jgi:hypothetical protein
MAEGRPAWNLPAERLAAAKSGKHTLVPGLINKVLIVSTRLTPRRVPSLVAASMSAPKGEPSRGE